jgi:Na+/melibiose symporter-like transporter
MSQSRAVLDTRGVGVEWRLLLGLVAIQAAISIAWVVYNIYLPDLLKQFGFDPAFGLTLLVLENFIAAFMEPIMGGISDRLKQRLGSSVPLIVAGIILAAFFFMAIPVVVIFGNPESMTRWLLPGTMVIWATAMTIFRSPTIALLGRCVSAPNLPQAFSLLVVIGILVNALKPFAQQFILSLGAPFAFTISSLVFIATAALLRIAKARIPDLNTLTPNNSHNSERQPLRVVPQLFLIGLLGISIALVMRLAIGETLPRLIQLEIAGANPKIWMAAFALVLAIFSLVAGKLATKIGNELFMTIGCVGGVLLLGLMLIVHGTIATVISIALLLACLSAANIGTIPLALTATTKARNGLGVGMYYGGAATTTSLFGLIFPLPAEIITLSSSIMMAAIALIGSVILIAVISRSKSLLGAELSP